MVTLLARFAPILAAEGAASGGRPIPDWARGNTIFETFFKGGPVMYPIVAVLVVAVAVALASDLVRPKPVAHGRNFGSTRFAQSDFPARVQPAR